jgi:hypothetical protein
MRTIPKKPSGRRNLSNLKEAVRNKYVWPGGYPLSAITFDGSALCMDCVRKNWRNVCQETLIKGWEECGWGVRAVEILWEGGNYCEHCNECLDAYPTVIHKKH